MTDYILEPTGDPATTNGAARMAPEPSKRLTLSAVLEQVLHRGSGQGDGVILSRNAKGETQIEVTVRTREGEDVSAAGRRSRDEYDRNRAAYPLSTGYVGAVSDPRLSDVG